MEIITLCTLYLQDRIIRVATRPISVPDADAETTWWYDAGLLKVGDLTEELDAYGLSWVATLQQASVDLVLPDDVVAAAFDNLWNFIGAAQAEIAFVQEGQDWSERRIVVARTIVSMPKMGLANASLSFGMETKPTANGLLIGDPYRDMGDEHPTLGFTLLDGTQYPTVIGRVYRAPAYKIGLYSGGGHPSTGHPVLLLLGHRVADNVGIPDLYEDGEAYVPIGALTLNQTSDESGKMLVIDTNNDDFTDPGGVIGTAQGAFTADYPNGAMPAFRAPQRGARNAAEVIEYLLSASGERIDWATTRPALDFLGDWDLGLLVEEATPAIKLLKDRLLPWLPVALSVCSEGLALVRCAPWLEPLSFHLVDGQNCSIDQSIEYTDQTIVKNNFTLRFYYDGIVGDYTGLTSLGTEHPACRLSQQLFGVRSDDELSCNVCWDERTAKRILDARAMRLALLRRRMRGVLDADLYRLRVGQVGKIESERLGISERRCFIRSLQPATDGLPFSVELLPDTALAAGDI